MKAAFASALSASSAAGCSVGSQSGRAKTILTRFIVAAPSVNSTARRNYKGCYFEKEPHQSELHN
jgi:hypothetical protein